VRPPTESWDIYPAIDLRQGRVVRLVEGDPGRETEYGTDPQAVAARWVEAGASWIHVVNLDGALGEGLGEGSEENLSALRGILGSGARVQFGGGLRSIDSVLEVLRMGVARVLIGTAALLDPELVAAALREFGPERIAVALDARDGVVLTHGWQESSQVSAADLAREWHSGGVRWVVHTDVGRDGTGAGLNVAASAHLADTSGLNVIASGGVAALEDVVRAHEAGLNGVVIGLALYEGQVQLADALAVGTSSEEQSQSRR
jgi:phosphoribosylformimino-5-aminoimidazole carboxamide ribotide isomerase